MEGGDANMPSSFNRPRAPTSDLVRHPALRRILQFFVSHGPLHGLHVLAVRLRRRHTPYLTSPLDLFPRHIPPSIHPFDVTYHVDTSGFLHGEDLGAPLHPSPGPAALSAEEPPATRPAASQLLPSTLWNTAYYAIAPSLFDRALALIPASSPQSRADLPQNPAKPPQTFTDLPTTPPDWRTFTFVDLGCGKGRALLLASRFPFKRILGVELDAALAAIAQANLRVFNAPWQQCHGLAVLHADATTIDLPPTPLLLYLYHPFLAPALKRVLRRLEQSLRLHPRELWLVYINPEAAHILRSFPFLRPVTHTLLTLDPEDVTPDRLGSSREEAAIYHYTPSAQAARTPGHRKPEPPKA